MLVAIVSPPPGATFVDKAQWVATGFNEAGHSVIRCHTLEDVAAADKIADLVVLDQKGAGQQHIDVAIAAERRRSTWAICWRDLIRWDDVSLAEQDDLKLFGRLMRAVDAVFIKERDIVPDFARLGINAVYLDTQGCPSEMPAAEHRESPEFDVLVLGRTDYPQRRRDVQALVAAGYRVVWAGLPDSVGVPEGVTAHPWVHPTKELPALASRCACALSVDMVHRDGYTSDRTWLLAGCGIPVVARVSKAENHSASDVAAWTYREESGLQRAVCEAIGEPVERRRRGERGRQLVMERHTYRQRVQAIIAQVQSLQAATAQ